MSVFKLCVLHLPVYNTFSTVQLSVAAVLTHSSFHPPRRCSALTATLSPRIGLSFFLLFLYNIFCSSDPIVQSTASQFSIIDPFAPNVFFFYVSQAPVLRSVSLSKFLPPTVVSQSLHTSTNSTFCASTHLETFYICVLFSLLSSCPAV